jgi:H/ACA ribonucleoprotein complex subunit 4
MKGDEGMKELLEFAFFNIDKPSGPTSFQVSEHVKEMLGVRKTSHLGTLDPQVSGVLPIATNRACRLAKYLMRKEKSYVGIMRLHEEMDEKALKEAMDSFVGLIKQIPPVRSSVKRAERERSVYGFKILEKNGKDVVFECDVEAGTYVRTLIHDLGKKIGGAHMLELRRTQAGVFDEKDSIKLGELQHAIDVAADEKYQTLLRGALIPGEQLIRQAFPWICVKESSLPQLLRGKPIHKRDVIGKPAPPMRQPRTIAPFEGLEKGMYIGVWCKDRFVEIARVVNSGDLVAVPDFVYN